VYINTTGAYEGGDSTALCAFHIEQAEAAGDEPWCQGPTADPCSVCQSSADEAFKAEQATSRRQIKRCGGSR
jgi:hypothetical protein